MKTYITWLLTIIFIIYLSSCWKVIENSESEIISNTWSSFVDLEKKWGWWDWEPISQTWSRNN